MTRAGDRDAALYRLASVMARRGFAIAIDLLGDRSEAEDAVQEALARAAEDFGRLRDPAALDAWFVRVLTNVCLRTMRRRRLLRFFGLGGAPDDAPDETPRADDRLAGAAMYRTILAGLDRLPTMHRAALVLRYGHDMPVAEIAAVLQIGAGTVKTHLTRGLARLRQELPDDAR